MGETNGKRFIDRLIAASPLERRKVTVLGQDIYFKPLTRKMLADAVPKESAERDPDYVGLYTLVYCAEDEAGAKLFTVRDIDALREKVSVELIRQLEAAMMSVVLPSSKEVDKVVRSDPPSASA